MNRRTFLASLVAGSLAALSLTGSARAADAGFSFADTQGKHLDVLLDGKIVGRYMYQLDRSSPDTLKATFKPFLHVFDAEGKAPITKGAEGEPFPHHRGIYVGWNKIGFEGKSYDRWHLRDKGATVHTKFVDQKASADEATFTSVVTWEGANPEQAILEEHRTMTFRRAPAPGRFTIDLTSKLTAPIGDVKLDGDPEHAGIQYRPAAEVTAKESVYVFPGEGADPTKQKDFPWVGLTYTLNGVKHSVVNMAHPENPKDTRWSAYRDYGRFGAFPVIEIKKGSTATVRHRFLIAEGTMPPAAYIQQSYDQFAGAAQASPVPPVTVKPVGAAKPATPKPAAKPAGEKPASAKPAPAAK